MARLRVLLLVVAVLPLFGAVCVTHVEQKGPAGPWVIEVTNSGPDPVPGVVVHGRVFDASGKEFTGMFDATCPRNLSAGQKGYYVKSAISDIELSQSRAVLPLQMVASVLGARSRSLFAYGVNLQVVARYDEHRAVLVEMRNDSTNTYHQVEACAVLLDAAGEAQEMASTRPFRTSTFRPGDTTVFPMAFNSPVEGEVRVFADAFVAPDADVLLDNSRLKLGASRIIDTERGRELQVVGEVENDTGIDLYGVRYQTYLHTSPTTRASGRVTSLGWAGWSQWGGYFDGTGFIPAGQKAPIAFSLLLDEDGSTRVDVAGIEGFTSPFRLSRLPVSAISSHTKGSDSVEISAMIRNPTSKGMQVPYACFNLRGLNDRLVGTSCRLSEWIEPNGSVAIAQLVTELGLTRSVEVIAYGYPSPKIGPVP